MKFKVVLAASLVLGLSFASLINTTDQINRSNIALGGNPAAKVGQTAKTFEGGLTLMDKIAQSNSLLGSISGAGTTGKDIDPKSQMFSDMFLQGAMPLGMGVLTVAYEKNTDVGYSIKGSVQNTNRSAVQSIYDTASALKVAYGIDLSQKTAFTPAIKGLAVGAELASNTDTSVTYQKVNNKNDWGTALKERTEINAASPYTSLVLGAIYDLDATSKVTVGQKFAAARNWDNKGQYSDLDKAKDDTQYNEEMQPETAIGYIYDYSDKITVGGTLTLVGDKTYDVNYTDSVNGSREFEKVKIGYKKYTINGEYAFAKDLAFQGYYGWADKVGQFKTDLANNNAVATDEGKNITEMGISAVKTMGDHTFIVGLARTVVIDENNDSNDDTSSGWKTDDTNLYANYGYKF